MIGNAQRKVVVTPRKSVLSPFVAPELSPVQAHLMIDEKGRPGWTDFEKKVPSIAKPKRHTPDVTISGDVIRRRREPATRVVLNATGPSATHKAMRARAEALRLRGVS
jgi:hypothetical protein